MPAIAICSGCGVREPMIEGKDGIFHTPTYWYTRADEHEGIQLACSKECIKKIDRNTGKKPVIIPLK